MKQTFFIIVFTGLSLISYSQETEPADSASWKFSTDVNFYFIPNDFIVLPVFLADKGKLHLEARYNYEDIRTLSVWAGYNFSGGKKIEYTITPMLGGVAGNSNGIAPGLEFTFTKGKFELYSESEYFFDSHFKEYNFMYTWTDLTYSIKDWWWVGLSIQRTRLYKTELDIQRGLLMGATWKKLDLTTYVYNLGYSPFLLLTLTANF